MTIDFLIQYVWAAKPWWSSYLAKKRRITFSEFRTTYSCTLEDAIKIIREISAKKHVFVVVDEFARVFKEKANGDIDFGQVADMMQDVSAISDFIGENRVNFLFSSVASVPLHQLASRSVRAFQVILILPRSII